MSTTLQMRAKGTLVIPAELRQKYALAILLLVIEQENSDRIHKYGVDKISLIYLFVRQSKNH